MSRHCSKPHVGDLSLKAWSPTNLCIFICTSSAIQLWRQDKPRHYAHFLQPSGTRKPNGLLQEDFMYETEPHCRPSLPVPDESLKTRWSVMFLVITARSSTFRHPLAGSHTLYAHTYLLQYVWEKKRTLASSLTRLQTSRSVGAVENTLVCLPTKSNSITYARILWRF